MKSELINEYSSYLPDHSKIYPMSITAPSSYSSLFARGQTDSDLGGHIAQLAMLMSTPNRARRARAMANLAMRLADNQSKSRCDFARALLNVVSRILMDGSDKQPEEIFYLVQKCLLGK